MADIFAMTKDFCDRQDRFLKNDFSVIFEKNFNFFFDSGQLGIGLNVYIKKNRIKHS